MKKLGFIGIGVMGQALMKAASKTLLPENIIIYDHTLSKCQTAAKEIGCEIAASPEEIVEKSTRILLCVQPERVEPLLKQLLWKVNTWADDFAPYATYIRTGIF